MMCICKPIAPLAALVLLGAFGTVDAGVCKYCKYAKFCDSDCDKCPCTTEWPNCNMCGYCKYCKFTVVCDSCADGGMLKKVDDSLSSVGATTLRTLGFSDAADAMDGVDQKE